VTTSAGHQRASTGGSVASGRLAGAERTSSLELFLRRVLARVIDVLPLALLCAGLWVASADVLESVSGACNPAPAADCNVAQESSFIDDAGREVLQFTMLDGRVIDATHGTYQFGNTTYIADPPEPVVYLAGLAYVLVVFVLLQGLTGWTLGKLAAGIRLADRDRRRPGIVRAFVRWALPDGALGVVGVLIAVAEGPWPLRLLAVLAALGLLRFVGELAPALLGPISDRRLGVQIVASADYVGGRPASDGPGSGQPQGAPPEPFDQQAASPPPAGSTAAVPSTAGSEAAGAVPFPMPPPSDGPGPDAQPVPAPDFAAGWPAPEGPPVQHDPWAGEAADEPDAVPPEPSPVPSLRSVPDLRPMPSIFEPEPTVLVPAAGAPGDEEGIEDPAIAPQAEPPEDQAIGGAPDDAAVDRAPIEHEEPTAADLAEAASIEEAREVSGAPEAEPASAATEPSPQAQGFGPDIRSFPAPPLASGTATPPSWGPAGPTPAADLSTRPEATPDEAAAAGIEAGAEDRIEEEAGRIDAESAPAEATAEAAEAAVPSRSEAAPAETAPAEPAEPVEPDAARPAEGDTAALADAATAANMANNPYRPQWDAARHAYICWEPVSAQWLQWDDVGELWGPISQ
jgi:hypothetical protein